MLFMVIRGYMSKKYWKNVFFPCCHILPHGGSNVKLDIMAAARLRRRRKTTAQTLISAIFFDRRKEKNTQNNMRSLLGLICVIVAASFYLYSLSLYLPAGPRRRPVQTAGRETLSEHPDSEEPSRFLLSHKQLAHYI